MDISFQIRNHKIPLELLQPPYNWLTVLKILKFNNLQKYIK